MNISRKSLKIKVSDKHGQISAILDSVKEPEAVFVFAHGAGAGIHNKFMETMANLLAQKGIAVLRFNFLYMENGKKVPDTKPLCIQTIKAAVDKASGLYKNVPLFAGGKSFGGRMTSTAASEGAIPNVKGIVFFGFPLHAPGKASNERAEHLYKITQPMLFLQGTRDALADLAYLKPVCKKLGKKAKLVVIENADHSFHVPKGNKLNDREVLDLICGNVKNWIEKKI